MNFLEVVQNAIEWLASPVGKTLALYASGRLLKAWPKFFDGAIPAGTAAVNLLITVLGLLAQAAGGGTGGAHAFAVVAMEQAQPANLVLDIILPQLIADGAYNWPRKVWRWFSQHALRMKA